MRYSMIFVSGKEIFAKTGQRESKISRNIQLVIAPGKKGSPSLGMSGKQFLLAGEECAGN